MTAVEKTLRAVAAFIPSNIARKLAQGEVLSPGQEFRMTGVALFADIAGFTPMAEQLVNLMETTEHGAAHRGAEELNLIINQTFTAIIQLIHNHGGFVTRFGGDALTAFFPDREGQSAQQTIYQALQCASQIQAAIIPLSAPSVEGHTFSISIKVGLSYGPAVTIILGQSDQFREVILAGPALDTASAAEHHANRGDNVVALNILEHFPQLDCSPAGDGFARLNALPEPPAPIERRADILADISANNYNDFLLTLTPYLPHTVFRRVMMTQGEIPGEYRRVSNIFCLFEGINYTDNDAGEKLQAYIVWAYQTVSRFGGTLLRVLTGDKGSTLHITFGAPDQHPNDIERALRCALALRDDPARPSYITNQKIGLASGLVFVAPIGAPERREYTVVGNEINLSARLMAATDPNTILVDEYSRERVAQQFEFSALPPLSLKGKAEPVLAYHLLKERLLETGLEARFLTSRWPIVGRDDEIAKLTQIANQAMKGKGQIIALSGNLGVGKTRLIEEVVRYWIQHQHNGFMGQCNQHLQNNPYQLWISFWNDYFRFTPETPASEKRSKITELTGYIAPALLPWVDAIGEILGLTVPEDSPLMELDAEQRQKKLFQLSLALLKGRAQQRPLLILFEDLHWVDEASARLIDYISARIKDSPILICLLFRSNYTVPAETIAQPHCTWRALPDLPEESIEPLMQSILGQAVIPPDVVRDMFDRTQGTPLYVEEILNNLIARNILQHDGQRYIFKDRSQLAQTPDTLEDLVRARLDRLGTEIRDLAQVAAVIDREFSYNMLHDVYPYPIGPEQMQSRLDELRFQDITSLTQPEPNPSYLFKHALTYEIAYSSLAFSRRQKLHRQIATAIETLYAASLEEHFGTLAYHYHQANILDKAFHYTLEAGERAQNLYANNDALKHYEQAEGFLSKLPLAEHYPDAIRLYLNKAQVHHRNANMQQAAATLQQALEIAQTFADTCSQAQAYNLKATFAFYQEQADVLQEMAQTALNLAQQHNHPREEANALYHLGVANLMTGQSEPALNYLQQARTLAAQRQLRALESEAMNKIGTVHFFDGQLEQALQAYQQVQQTRQQLGLKDKQAETLSNIATLQFRLNQPVQALKTAAQAIDLAQEAGWQPIIPYLKLLQVEILAYQGNYAQAQNLMAEIYALFDPGDEIGQAYAQLTHGREILLDINRPEQAEPLLNDSLAVMTKYNIYEEIPRALVSLGLIRSRAEKWAEAETYFEQACQICLERQKGWYLSETYSHLAEALLQQGKLDEALKTAQLGLQSIKDLSNPDWKAHLLVITANIARRQKRPPNEVETIYKTALEQSKTRGRAINRHRLYVQIGSQMLITLNPQTRQTAEDLVRQGLRWLNSHNASTEALEEVTL